MKTLSKIADVSTAVVGVCAVLLMGNYLLSNDSTGPAPNEDIVVEDWSDLQVGRWKGAKEPEVVIIEWGDYECPVCQWFHGQIEAVLRRYPNKVAMVYRHWPLQRHRLAYPAAIASECAGDQKRFWQFHKALYETEAWVGMGFRGVATTAGVPNIEQFERCVNDSRPKDRIDADIAAVKALGGRGTPTVLIDSLYLGLPPDSLTMFEVVEDILAGGES